MISCEKVNPTVKDIVFVLPNHSDSCFECWNIDISSKSLNVSDFSIVFSFPTQFHFIILYEQPINYSTSAKPVSLHYLIVRLMEKGAFGEILIQKIFNK